MLVIAVVSMVLVPPMAEASAPTVVTASPATRVTPDISGNPPAAKYYDSLGPLASTMIQVVDHQPKEATEGSRVALPDLMKFEQRSGDYRSALVLHLYAAKCTYSGIACVVVRTVKDPKKPAYWVYRSGPWLRGVAVNLYKIDGLNKSDYNVRQQRLCRVFAQVLGLGFGTKHDRNYGTSCLNQHQLKTGFKVTDFDHWLLAWYYATGDDAVKTGGSTSRGVKKLPVADFRRGAQTNFTLAA